jgi:hypothetical protein
MAGQLEEHDGDRCDRRGLDQRHQSRPDAPTGSTSGSPCCVMFLAVAVPAEDRDVTAAFVAEPVVVPVMDREASP